MAKDVKEQKAQGAIDQNRVRPAREAMAQIFDEKNEHETSLDPETLKKVLAVIKEVLGLTIAENEILGHKKPSPRVRYPRVITTYGQKYSVDLETGLVYTEDPRFQPKPKAAMKD